ncbi:HNH endonuclease signature motif containing protein [Streptomyces sp. C1-2]|uniref:HNH endonuclease n=1 Tax=Streptomyces sp. C1-2 TaxID=2720022 RepID=UPI0014325BDE|nr:HNH endonuclease signature motif containing protein [Streptomyces sp. C1-2]NJP72518.1 HNH endonuclease [Streptomyces sp. C1-2]
MPNNWHTSTRKSRLPRDWEKRRKQQLAMQPICMICGVRPSTVVDHIVPMTDRHEPEDLQGCCDPCHRQKTAKEAAAFRAASPRPTRARGDEPHPGLL